MGIFAGLGDLEGVDVKAIQAEMMPALALWFSAHIKIFDPGSDAPGTYDPMTDTTTGGAPETLVWDSGAKGALVQPIRAAANTSFGDQAAGLQGIRFQSAIPIPELRSGLRIQVVDGGNDPTLTGFTFALLSAVDSSIAWGRIYEARVVTT